jgi:hypothetical protein
VIIYPPEEQYSMKIGQFEDHEGLCVGVERAGTWINYSKAEALFYLLRHGVPIEPATTLQGMLESGEYNAGAIRQVVDYLARQGMTKQVAVHRDAVLKAPILRPPKIVALGPGRELRGPLRARCLRKSRFLGHRPERNRAHPPGDGADGP